MTVSRKAACLLVACLLPLVAGLTASEADAEARRLERAHQEAIDQVVPAYVMIGGGSGVVISPDGLMLTNHHVIKAGYDAGRRRFRLRVGTAFTEGTVLGTDPRGDIALLQIELDPGENLPYVELTDSDALEVGQGVIAIGNPFGTMQLTGDPTVTLGMISLLHRFNQNYSDAIMTDVAINPGNSGGPLLTLDGKLAGINGQINSKTGARANTGIGLAVPANQIESFLPKLQAAEGGVVLHGYLKGLVGDNEEADGLRNGAEIREVWTGSAAATAGLVAGDRIVAVDDRPVHNYIRLRGVLGTYPSDSRVELTWMRDGERMKAEVGLVPYDPGLLGLTFDLPEKPQAKRRLLLRLMRDPELEVPVHITELDGDLPVADSGLQKGDRLLRIDGEEIRNPYNLVRVQHKLMQEERFFAGDVITLTVTRGEDDQQEELAIEVELGSQLDKR